ncbi:MAG: carboxylesterase/lipase family protein, partial [Gammaproteobacteria bacterium]
FEGIDTGEGGAAFLGLPYAEPPLGERRWAAPLPWRASGGTRSAMRFAPGCLQDERMVSWYRELIGVFGGDPGAFPAPGFSEDCLYLNVWRPETRAGQKLPVLVWIHGGSNTGGWSSEPNYAGKFLAREGLVVVTIAYRLGVFGTFSLPGLPQSNFGLLDQIEALRWVRAHIAAFGGDASRVTVAGESAGASNIAHLLASPRAEGLFHRAIMQSGGYALRSRARREDGFERGLALAGALGLRAGDDPLAALRAAAADRVLSAAARVYPEQDFDPVVDGDTVPVPTAERIAAGHLARVPLLIGSNGDEWRMYLEASLDEAAWIRTNAPGQEAAIAGALSGIQDPLRRLDLLETANLFVCPSLWLAAQVHQQGSRAFVYHFTRVREGAGGERIGAYHGAEIPYVFGTHDAWLPTTADDRGLGERLMAYWRNFAASGDPNGRGLPIWPAWDAQSSRTMRLDRTDAPLPHPSA